MKIKNLIFDKNVMVHKNETREVFEAFNKNGSNKDFVIGNCRIFVVEKDGWLADHYRNDEEIYLVLNGSVDWFFEDMVDKSRDCLKIERGSRIKIPSNVAHALKVKKGDIIVGFYKKSFEELKTNKYVLGWARNKV